MSFTDRIRQVRRRIILRSGKNLIRTMSRIIASQSLIGNTPVFDKSVFSWTGDFEANWKKIRAELEQVLRSRDELPSFHELSPDQYRISRGDNWKTFVFYVFGERFDPNCTRCPETARLLDRTPHIRNAWFSILAPHYHIPPHKGPTNGIIRIHLGLIVPRDPAAPARQAAQQFAHRRHPAKCLCQGRAQEHAGLGKAPPGTGTGPARCLNHS